jgi:hypothetical protein
MNNIGFPTEYAVSGWYKWTPLVDRSEWHQMFRLTINNPTDVQDLSRFGDRDLAVWAGRTCDCYHYTSYSYAVANVFTGQLQQYTNIPTGVFLPTWAFVYFGYSRTARIANAYVRWTDKEVTQPLTNTNHYLSNDFWFYLPNNQQWYPIYNG